MPLDSRRHHLWVAGATALILLVVAGWSWTAGRNAVEGDSASAAESDPRCGRVLREPVGDAGAHIDSRPITYLAAPPSYGDHRSRWEVRAHSFYDIDDRPEVPVLVHNLEHGYNILWYDQTVAQNPIALAQVQEIADHYATLDGKRDPSTAFIAAPWTSEDGPAFPDDMHVALTHWYADPTDRTRSRDDEIGLTRYCATVSAEVVRAWMDDYPLRDAPEGYPGLM